MSSKIHPSSVIDKNAIVADDVSVGPFCVIGPNVAIGRGSVLKSHVVLEGNLKIGEENIFYPGAVIGTAPQDTGYKEEPTKVEIGDRNIFREHTTVHKGTTKQDGITIIKDDCLIMCGVHVGHDCVVNEKVILVNNVLLGGHCVIGEGSFIGGGSSLQQFSRIGRGCFIGGGSPIEKDLPAFSTGYGNRMLWRGLNVIGLKRRGFAKKDILMAMKFFDDLSNREGTYKNYFADDKRMSLYKGNSIIEEIISDIKLTKNGVAAIRRRD